MREYLKKKLLPISILKLTAHQYVYSYPINLKIPETITHQSTDILNMLIQNQYAIHTSTNPLPTQSLKLQTTAATNRQTFEQELMLTHTHTHTPTLSHPHPTTLTL